MLRRPRLVSGAVDASSLFWKSKTHPSKVPAALLRAGWDEDSGFDLAGVGTHSRCRSKRFFFVLILLRNLRPFTCVAYPQRTQPQLTKSPPQRFVLSSTGLGFSILTVGSVLCCADLPMMPGEQA